MPKLRVTNVKKNEAICHQEVSNRTPTTRGPIHKHGKVCIVGGSSVLVSSHSLRNSSSKEEENPTTEPSTNGEPLYLATPSGDVQPAALNDSTTSTLPILKSLIYRSLSMPEFKPHTSPSHILTHLSETGRQRLKQGLEQIPWRRQSVQMAAPMAHFPTH